MTSFVTRGFPWRIRRSNFWISLLTNIELILQHQHQPGLGFPGFPADLKVVKNIHPDEHLPVFNREFSTIFRLEPGRSHTTSTNMGTKRWTTSCDAALDLVLVKTVSKKITASWVAKNWKNDEPWCYGSYRDRWLVGLESWRGRRWRNLQG